MPTMSSLSFVDENYIVVTLIVALNIWLGFWVYRSNKGSKINQQFSLLTFFLLLWTILCYLKSILPLDISLILVKLAYGIVALFYIPFYFFLKYFPKEEKTSSIFDKSILGICFFLFFFAFSSRMVRDVKVIAGKNIPILGEGRFIYLGLISLLLLFIILTFLRKYLKLSKEEKLKSQYFLIGLAIFIFINSIFNIILPLLEGQARYACIGNHSAIFLLAFTAYAIVKQQLFGIKIVLTELLAVVVSIVLFLEIIFAPTFLWRVSSFFTLFFFLLFAYYLIIAMQRQERRRQVAEEIAEKERKLRQRAERIAHELQHLNQIRNQMFLTGQHHTRTPLSNIKNFASVLLSGGYGPINKEQKHALEVIMSQVNQSIELANLYLSVSQFEAGRALLKKERTDICQLIKEQIEKLKIEAQAKGVKIITRFEKDIPQAEVDKAQLGLSIFAIIDNAIKYSPRGRGRVEVSIKKKDHNRILLSFKDNGIGIAKENIDYIGRFAFQRTERAKRIHGTGKGLALYFANLVVKEHKGKLWVESEGPNKGATFYIELPVK